MSAVYQCVSHSWQFGLIFKHGQGAFHFIVNNKLIKFSGAFLVVVGFGTGHVFDTKTV